MAKDDRPSSKIVLTPVERLRQAALEYMDGPELLKLIKEVEEEIRRRRIFWVLTGGELMALRGQLETQNGAPLTPSVLLSGVVSMQRGALVCFQR